MPAVPTVQASSTLKVVDEAERRGADRAALLAAVGLDEEVIADPEARVAFRALARLYEVGAAATGDATFGLHVGDASHPRMFDVMGAVALRSATVRRAFAGILRFYRVLQEGARLELEVSGPTARLRYTITDPQAAPCRHEVEATVAIVYRWLRVALGRSFPLRDVAFAHPRPRQVAEHRRVLGRTPRFDAGENLLAFDAALLDEPLAHADPTLAGILERVLAERHARLPKDGLLDGVRARVASGLRDGAPSPARIARELGVSERTLQRRLADEGRSFRDVVDDVRRELAVALLRGGAAIGEVAGALGFRDAGGFHRAFRRWTGSTPATWRAAELGRARR